MTEVPIEKSNSIIALGNEKYYFSSSSLLTGSLVEAARLARLFSRKLSSLRRHVIRPVLHEIQTGTGSGTGSNGTEMMAPGWSGSGLNREYSNLCDSFNQLTIATTQNSIGLNHWIRYYDSYYDSY